MKQTKLLTLFALTSLLVFSCKKEDNEEVITNYPSIVGEWIIVRYDKTVIKDGTLDETQTMKVDYPGTILFNENGSEVVNFNGVKEQNTYIDKGDYITTNNTQTNKKSKLTCRIRTSNQLIIDITETNQGNRINSSYTLEKVQSQNYTSLVGKWEIIKFDQTVNNNGIVDQNQSKNQEYIGNIVFNQDGSEIIEINSVKENYTYSDKGQIIIAKNTAAQEFQYIIRLRTEQKLIFDIVETVGSTTTTKSYILEKAVINPYLSISGNWLIIRFDQTEYINGNINWTNTVNYWNPGYWDFYSDGTATLYMNHITYTYTYQIVGPNIVFRQISTGIVVDYRFRLWNDHRIIIDHVETSAGHEKSTSFILEKN